MSQHKGILYQNLFSAYKKCYPDKKPVLSQQSVNLMWKTMKAEYKNQTEFEKQVQEKISQLQVDATTKKSSRINFFVQVRGGLRISRKIYFDFCFF